MKRRTLLQTNPYLRDSKIREKMNILSAITSTRIEGVDVRLKKNKKSK
jgi:hypothetical protein